MANQLMAIIMAININGVMASVMAFILAYLAA